MEHCSAVVSRVHLRKVFVEVRASELLANVLQLSERPVRTERCDHPVLDRVPKLVLDCCVHVGVALPHVRRHG
eukprot:123168-Prymnesium_polylepis.1